MLLSPAKFGGIYESPCPSVMSAPYLSYEKTLEVHTKIPYDLCVYNDFNLRSFEQGQGNWMKKCEILVWYLSIFNRNNNSSFFTQR